MREKSSKHTNPSPFLSTPSIILRQSSNVQRSSPIVWKTDNSSSAVIFPSWSVSKKSKVSRSSVSPAGPHSDPTRVSNASTLMQPCPSPSTSLNIMVTSSWLSGSAPSRLRRASSSFRETMPSLSRSMSLNAWTSSNCFSAEISPQSRDSRGKTLLGVPIFANSVPEPGLWSDTAESELEEDEVEEVADPNESGSWRDTSGRFFLDPKRRFGLSLRDLGSFIMRRNVRERKWREKERKKKKKWGLDGKREEGRGVKWECGSSGHCSFHEASSKVEAYKCNL